MKVRKRVICGLAIAMAWIPAAMGDFTSFPIATGPAEQMYPDVSDRYVAYAVGRSIYGYDLYTATQFTICTDSFTPSGMSSGAGTGPAVSGKYVVWTDMRGGGWDIYGYNMDTREEFAISTGGVEPSISGDIVVWADGRNMASSSVDIYGYDLRTKTEFAICTDAGPQGSPSVSGDTVVWQSGGGWITSWDFHGDIYGYDLSTWTEFPICTNHRTRHVDIDGRFVVWNDARNNPYGDIYGYDLWTKTEFPICTHGSATFSPSVSGDFVVWADLRPGSVGPSDIYGYDLRTNTEFSICTDVDGQWWPSISGYNVVWTDTRGVGYDIYGAVIPAPGAILLGILGLGAAGLKLRRFA